jgi:peptidoglycan/LPS O-acetylase OafA/YrhL
MNSEVKHYEAYVPGIDGLRAIAVIAVIWYHAFPLTLPGGFSGVDVFFVISGYVISRSLFQNSSSSLVDFIIYFYHKRILRIMPALIACLLVVSFIVSLFIPLSWLSGTIGLTTVAALLGVSNVVLAYFGDGYFSPREEFNPLVHTWSLGLEEQFYIIFPFIFYYWQKNYKNNLLKLLNALLLPLLILMSLLISIHLTKSSPVKAYYLMPARLWELGAGALLFRLHIKNIAVPKSNKQSLVYTIAGFIIMLSGFIYSGSGKSSFPFPLALLSVAGTSAMISGALLNQRNKNMMLRLLESKPSVIVGKMSYSLYLWHWPLLSVGKWTLGLKTNLEILAAIILAILFSIASYHYIETPFLTARFPHNTKRLKVIVKGAAALGISLLVVSFTIVYRSQLSMSVTCNQSVWYPSVPGEDDTGFTSIKGKILRLIPDRNKLAQQISCVKDTGATQHERKRLFVIGDSHALAYSTMLGMVSDNLGMDIYLYGKGGQSIANLQVPIKGDGAYYQEYFERAFREIEAIARPGDFVLFASLRMDRLSSQWVAADLAQNTLNVDKNKQHHDRQLALQEASDLIDRFEKASLNVIIDAPKPVFKAPLFRCSDWFNLSNPVCSAGFTVDRTYLSERRQPVMDSIRILQKRHPGLIIWDPFPILCPSDTCAAYDQNGPLFFDGDHLTAYGNRLLYPGFAGLIQNRTGRDTGVSH